jgi:hypothetical protein
MHPFTRIAPLALTVALCAVLGSASPAFAQSTDDPAPTGGSTVPQDRLADRYSTLAGSDTAAGELVGQLRSGGDFSTTSEVTTTNADGTTTTSLVTTTVTNPNGPMGWGEVNLTLALAEALVESGAATDLQSALTGTSTTVTNADGTTTTTTTGGVLAMRADGMGWGEIAQELGFNLGTLISAGNRNARAAEAQAAGAGNAKAAGAAASQAARGQAARADRGAGRPDSAGAGRPARPDIGTRPQRPETPTRPERPERPQRPERGGR